MSFTKLKGLVACEYSQAVAGAFRDQGHEVYSCDILPAEPRQGESEGQTPWHIQGDARFLLRDGWDFLIGHPPCTDLAVSGAGWFKNKKESQQAALDFFARLWCAPIRHIALENPVSVVSSWIAKPTQIIQPWQFGHGEAKKTCLWLKDLPGLVPTDVVEGREQRILMMPERKGRQKDRSRTYLGIAEAMAAQWGEYMMMKHKNNKNKRTK